MIVATPYNDNVIVYIILYMFALYYNDEYMHYTAVFEEGATEGGGGICGECL